MQLVALGTNVAECSALECAQATQIMSCFPLECEEIPSLGRGYPTRLRKRSAHQHCHGDLHQPLLKTCSFLLSLI